jgi:hypothetical protein
MSESSVRTTAAPLLICLLFVVFVTGCIADTIQDPADADTGFESDTESIRGDASDDPDEDGIPSASDICPDTYDPRQNDWDQDGAGDACDPTIDLNESNALVMRDLPVQEWAQIQLSSIGDFDGDGFDDFAVGVPAFDNARGKILLFYGGVLEDTKGRLTIQQSSGVLSGELQSDVVGCALEAIGDVNGDNLDDFVTLQCEWNNRQGVHLILGRPSMEITGEIKNFSEMVFSTSRSGKLPGATLLRMGDINNDRMDDFAVASWDWMRVVRIIPGSGTFPADVGRGDHHFLDEWTNAAATMEIQDPTALDSPIQFAPLGDINADGETEIGIVDSYFDDGPSVTVHILPAGSFPSEVGQAIPIEEISEGSDFAGGSISPTFTRIGDVNGDGHSDFSFSTPRTASTNIFFGSATGISPSDLLAPDTELIHPTNTALVGGLDVDADGFSDLLYVDGDELLVLSGNREWKKELALLDAHSFDGVISFPMEGSIRSIAIEPIGNLNDDSIAEFGIVMEEPRNEGGRIWFVQSDLPLKKQ